MIFNGFKLHAVPTIHEAYCTNKKCKKKPELVEVSNGLLSISLFCKECKSVYILKLERQEKVSKAYIQQCIDEVEGNRRTLEVSRAFREELDERDTLEKNKRLKRTKKFLKNNK